MSTNQPYAEELKLEAVKQIAERGHKVAEVSARSASGSTACTSGSRSTVRSSPSARLRRGRQAEEWRRRKAEIRRVTEERDILEEAARIQAMHGTPPVRTMRRR